MKQTGEKVLKLVGRLAWSSLLVKRTDVGGLAWSSLSTGLQAS